jgi:hypothetical protein
LLFFSPELTSRDVNAFQRSAEETLIVRRVLVGDATLFRQARARGFRICVGSFRETSRLNDFAGGEKFVKKRNRAS